MADHVHWYVESSTGIAANGIPRHGMRTTCCYICTPSAVCMRCGVKDALRGKMWPWTAAMYDCILSWQSVYTIVKFCILFAIVYYCHGVLQ